MFEEMNAYLKKDMYGEALIILQQLRKNLPDYAVNRQILDNTEILISLQLHKICAEEAVDKMVYAMEITLPFEYIDRFILKKGHGLMKDKPVCRRIFLTQQEIYCLNLIGNYYERLKDYEKVEKYMEMLFEYFQNSESDTLLGKINVYNTLAVQYSSLLGNMGNYNMSNDIADKAAFTQLMERRLEAVWWHKYNNLWNDAIEKSDTEEYNSEIRKCIALCQICNASSAEKFFMKQYKL